VTLEGAEVINAPDNALYTHSYIFNFGIPFKHTGILTTTHVNPMLDIYLGVDTGVNTTFGNHLDCFNCGDNNRAAAFHGGFGLNLLDGALTIAATTHIGPENPNVTPVILAGVDPNSALRYLNDVTVVWKATDKLTLTTDANYIRDDGSTRRATVWPNTRPMRSTTGSRSLDAARSGATITASSSPPSRAIWILSGSNMATLGRSDQRRSHDLRCADGRTCHQASRPKNKSKAS